MSDLPAFLRDLRDSLKVDDKHARTYKCHKCEDRGHILFVGSDGAHRTRVCECRLEPRKTTVFGYGIDD